VNLHPKTHQKGVSLACGTPLGVGTCHGHLDTQDSPRPGLGGSHHLPLYSILCGWSRRLHPNGTFLLGLSKSSPETVPAGLSELWTAIAPRPKLRSGRILNQSCSSRRELSNAVSHSSRRRWKEVDSWLLVVGSQTSSLTPGPSFAHNLGCRCPNGQCEAIFDIYVSRPFQWHQEHPNARCFGPCCRALNIREFQRTPNLQLFQVSGFTPTLGQSGVATTSSFQISKLKTNYKMYWLVRNMKLSCFVYVVDKWVV